MEVENKDLGLAAGAAPLVPSAEPTTASTPRPSRLTDDMKFAAAQLLVVDIKRDCFDFREEDSEELARQIADVVRGEWTDGYELGKRLDDRCGWSVDTVMVEALDNWSTHARHVLEAAQKAWREATNPQPAFVAGDRVQLKDGKTGEVTDADYKYGVAQCLVKVDGDPEADKSERRLVLNWEDVSISSRRSEV